MAGCLQPSRRNHGVNVGIELQPAIEGVENRDDSDSQAVPYIYQSLNERHRKS
jgi:hypothetical protein